MSAYPGGANVNTVAFGNYPENVEVPHIDIRDPAPTDYQYPLGKRWINRIDNTEFVLTSISAFANVTSGNWEQSGGGGTGLINTINLNTPIAGNYTLAGTANQISIAQTAGTSTFSLSSTLVAPGSLTVTSGFTVSAGAVTITSGIAAINISADAAATTINIGTGGAVKTVTIGSTNTTSPTTIQSGSGGITMTGVTTHNSNVILNGAATQLRVHGGAVTDFIGTATLASGTTGAIANTNIAAGDRIFIQRIAANASTTLGELSYTISAGASFTITSLIIGTPASPETGDLSTVGYFIVRQV